MYTSRENRTISSSLSKNAKMLRMFESRKRMKASSGARVKLCLFLVYMAKAFRLIYTRIEAEKMLTMGKVKGILLSWKNIIDASALSFPKSSIVYPSAITRKPSISRTWDRRATEWFRKKKKKLGLGVKIIVKNRKKRPNSPRHRIVKPVKKYRKRLFPEIL